MVLRIRERKVQCSWIANSIHVMGLLLCIARLAITAINIVWDADSCIVYVVDICKTTHQSLTIKYYLKPLP